jgi:nucleolar protein 12
VGEDTAIPIQIPLPTQQEGSQAADEEEEQGQNSDEARNESGEGSGSDDERSYDEEDAESDESDHSLEGEPQESPLDIEKREIFVGNVAVNTSKKQITSHFKKYGKIESIRFRSVAFVEPGGYIRLAFL